MNWKELCLNIAMAEGEQDVIAILKKGNFWDSEEYWDIVGGKETTNNQGIVGNQQSNPANALVEKIVNCGDSTLMLKCKEKKIDPKSEEAPKSVKEALETFFGVKNGKWINCQNSELKEIAQEYCNVVVTGDKKNPNYIIVDKAEGQAPDDFKTTFLRLNSNNKIEVQFVQGKFGMGSYGAVNFCKDNGLQLILSKRNPILNGSQPGKWGFTIIRKFEPTEVYRNSRWMYFHINGEIPSFDAEALKLLPGKYPEAYEKNLKHGTFIKLYNYDIGPGLRSVAYLNFFYKLNSLLPNPVVPALIYERRKGYKADGYEQILHGLETKLEKDKTSIIYDEEHFDFYVEEQKMTCKIYAFNKYNEEGGNFDPNRYANGVLFLVNGQTNGILTPSFFTSKGLKFENIKKNILVIIDCSTIQNKYIEKIFMPDREKIYQNAFTELIKKEIREGLKASFLPEFQNVMREQEVKEKIENNSEANQLLNELLKKSPYLAKFLSSGGRIGDPFEEGKKEKEKYEYSVFPTFFELAKKSPKEKPRQVEKGRSPRIKFKTDAPNDYFTRANDPGEYHIFLEGEEITRKSKVKLQGKDGIWFLHLPQPEKEIQKYKVVVSDIQNLVHPFKSEFYCQLIEKKEREGKPTPPSNRDNNLDLPEVTKVKKEKYGDYDYDVDENDAMWVMEHQDNTNTFYLNIDNKHYLNYLKTVPPTDTDLVKNQYEVIFVIISLALIKEHKKQKNTEESLTEYTKKINRAIAPVLLGLVRDLRFT